MPSGQLCECWGHPDLNRDCRLGNLCFIHLSNGPGNPEKEWANMTVQEEIERASVFGQQLEDIIVNKGSITLGHARDRDKLLLA